MGDILIAVIVGILIGVILGIPWGYAISNTNPEEIEELEKVDFD